MLITYAALLIIVFLLGFKSGKTFILKGLTYRVEQLHQEGDYRRARTIEEVLKSNKKH